MLEISSDLKIMIVVDERYYELSNMCLFCLFLASLLLSMLQMKKCNNPTKIFATETISLLTNLTVGHKLESKTLYCLGKDKNNSDTDSFEPHRAMEDTSCPQHSKTMIRHIAMADQYFISQCFSTQHQCPSLASFSTNSLHLCRVEPVFLDSVV